MIKTDSRTSELATKTGGNWKTIGGSKVLIGKGGKIIAGMGGKFANIADTKSASNGGFAFSDSGDFKKKLGAEKCAEMERLVSSSPVSGLWAKHADGVKIGDAEYKRGAHFDPNDNSIYFNKNNAKNDPYGTYRTITHEASHAIDFKLGTEIYANGYGRTSYAAAYKRGAFDRALRNDVDEFCAKTKVRMEAELKTMANKYKGTDKHREFTEELFVKGYIDSSELFTTHANLAKGKLPKVDKAAVHRAVSKEIMNEAGPNKCTSVSDIYGGATGGGVDAGYGHAKSYWRNRDNLAIEAFAQISSAQISQRGEVAVIEKFLPNAYKVYNEMVVDMTAGNKA